MVISLSALLVVLVVVFLYEYRLRKPDQIILYDSDGRIKIRKSRYYPRHYSLAVPGTVQTTNLDIVCEAKGKIGIRVILVATLAPSRDHISALIRVGGWHPDAPLKAIKEFDIHVHAMVKAYCEKYEIEELNSEGISEYLQKQFGHVDAGIGLDIISINVKAVDPVDEKIIDAMRQKETARILETTEKAKQEARINAEKVRIDADEKISIAEHELEMKRLELKKENELKDANIADLRVGQELERRKKQLEYDKQEIALLRDNPEFILLTPQVARLAEASQHLRNARTVVNLAAGDHSNGEQISNLIQTLLRNLTVSVQEKSTKTKSKK